jgi:hypothetical protein
MADMDGNATMAQGNRMRSLLGTSNPLNFPGQIHEGVRLDQARP